jgi:hypothetical protein
MALKDALGIDRLLGPLRNLDLRSGGLATMSGALRMLDRRATARPFEPFDALEADVMRTLVARLCRLEGDGAPNVDLDVAVRTAETWVMTLPPDTSAMLRRLLVVWEYQPWLYGPRRAPFTRLSATEQDANLLSWSQSESESRLAMFGALRRLAMVGFWTQSSTWTFLGYGGPTAGRA